MGLKEKPKNIIYEFYETDQHGKSGDTPLPFLGMLRPGRKLFDQGSALSGGRRESFRGGRGMGVSAEAARAGAGDQMDAMTAREDMNRTLSSIDFKDAMNNPSTTSSRGTLGLLGNKMARKRRRGDSGNTGPLAPGTTGTTNCLVPPCPQDGGPDTAANLSQEAALAQAAGSTATPKEKPEPSSSPEGNEGIKTTGGPTGAINIPTPPKMPSNSVQGGGISEGDYKLTKI